MRLNNLESYKLKKPVYTLDDELNQVLTSYEEVADIQANIQPATGQLKAQLYGLDLTKYHTVYCNINEAVQEGLYIEYDRKHHQIQSIQNWSTHSVFDIKAVD